ncbi:MAG TPA: hypothetical protein VFC51_18535 [Chloroflexota bacterium]|nr:hypothetical protein [Chloroflexota bacterium]
MRFGLTIGAATIVASALLLAPADGGFGAPTARAACDDGTTSLVPTDTPFSWSVTPACTAEGSGPDVILVTGGYVTRNGVVVVHDIGNANVVGIGVGVGYTRPGDTPYVNGVPVWSPYSNVFQFTPQQAAEQRAQGNPSATGNAYSQYGGFTPPGDTATHETSPSYPVTGQ